MLSLCQTVDSCSHICSKCQVRAVAICGALEIDELGELEQMLTSTLLPPKGTLFAEGDAAGHVFSVTSGCVRLSKDLADGRRQVVGFALPGDFLNLSLEKKFSFSADSIESTSLCRFPTGQFQRFLDRKPHVVRKLYDLAAHELTIAQEQMVLLGRRRADEKVACFLLNWRERLGRLTGADQTLHLPMTRQDMADYLGLTIETVSRTISTLVRRKVIMIVPEGVRILNIQELRTLAG
jgi:CRP/FNR family transcriptional regulator, anaerobic regulatory protein